MKALLDGDILAYRIAFRADTDGIDEVQNWVDDAIIAWTPTQVDPGDVVVCMSCPRETTFRRDFYPGYKAHREDRSKPESMGYVMEVLGSSTRLLECPRIEADDILGIGASGGSSIAVTVDKDLRTVPGWHWNPDKELFPIEVSLEEADKNFCIQWLTGDTTDNLPGIWRMGPAKAKKILEKEPPENWEAAVMATYEQAVDRNGEKYSWEYVLSMARCVRILRKGEATFVKKGGSIQNTEVSLWCPKVAATDSPSR